MLETYLENFHSYLVESPYLLGKSLYPFRHSKTDLENTHIKLMRRVQRVVYNVCVEKVSA